MSKVFNVYINGTDESSDQSDEFESVFSNAWGTPFSLANLLYAMTQDKENTAVCLDGCGIGNPYWRDVGVVFTWNLEKQLDSLVNSIHTRLSNLEPEEEKLILNLYEFSRGGAGVLRLCQKLNKIDPDQLEINVLAFEPVSGNFVNGVYIDKLLGLNSTLSSIIADLRMCNNNINNIKILFTHEPLPDIACHAPLLPALPSHAKVEVDVVPGCHKNAEIFFKQGDSIRPLSNRCAIAFHQVVDFLQKCGTRFDFSTFKLDDSLKVSDQNKILKLYEAEAWEMSETERSMHFSNIIYSRPKHRDSEDRKHYLNRHHQALAGVDEDPEDCMLFVQDPNPEPSFKNGQKGLHFLYPAVAIGVISACCVVLKASIASGTDPESLKIC